MSAVAQRHGIPRRLEILGHKVSVHLVSESRWKHGKGVCGMWRPASNRIDLLLGYPVSQLQANFFHELMHALFEYAGREDLSRDEGLVDKVAHLLQQVTTTWE